MNLNVRVGSEITGLSLAGGGPAEGADRTPPGEWVISSRCWHETHLREGRLPTARELDAASRHHPVFVQRGGHVGVANSAALRMGGITARMPLR